VNELLHFIQEPTMARDAVVGLIGLCVGSFLNVMALRSLQGRNWFWPPSSCLKCEHRLAPLDLLPLLSWLILKGKCRYCQATISWQYPLVELFTAVSFIIVLRTFGATFEGLGMIFFACVLIAICITDFREKLIPHEITYPSILIGLLYTGMSANMRSQSEAMTKINHDLVGSLVGIAISYMLFDFIAFYGGVLYVWMHKTDKEEAETEETDPQIDTTFDISDAPPLEEEAVEVMGGGDAVLGAVIAAWLGISRWGFALLVGFLLGTLMGGVYLTIEMKKQKILHKAWKPAAVGAALCLAAIELMLVFCAHLGNQPFLSMPWWQFGTVAAIAGALSGVIRAGWGISKPFPFGPALAGGAAVAMFFDPFTSNAGGA
jgi:prepilin signal peptidase PulO-like enzyme (type II secretory pathway)